MKSVTCNANNFCLPSFFHIDITKKKDKKEIIVLKIWSVWKYDTALVCAKNFSQAKFNEPKREQATNLSCSLTILIKFKIYVKGRDRDQGISARPATFHEST